MTHRPLSAAGSAALLGICLFAAPAGAAGLDTAFGTGGFLLHDLSPAASDRYQGVAAAPDGGTYNVGYRVATGTDRQFVLTKTTPTGELDATFGIGGVASVNVVEGPFAPAPAAPATPATPQATPSGGAEVARGVAVQSDGKIIVSGQAETIQDGSKPDSRDLDVYVARFTAGGVLDTTFGTNGVTRIDLSDGVQTAAPTATTTAVNNDQAWGLKVRPDDRIVLSTVKGTDSATNATKTDRDLAIVQLTASGQRDAAFGTNGVSVALNPLVNENPRGLTVNPDGSVISVGYGGKTGTNSPEVRPWLFKVSASGAPERTFGANGDGIASGPVGGPTPGFAEVYDIVSQPDGGYALGGYGRPVGSTNVDAVVYKFTARGVWDEGFGPDGVVSFEVSGGADQIRDLATLPDGRIIGVGSSVSSGNSDGAVFAVNTDGTKDTTLSPTGVLTVDFGGATDAIWSAAPVGNGWKIAGAGYLGSATAALERAAMTRVAFDPKPKPTPTPTPTVSPTPTVTAIPTPTPVPSPSPTVAPAPRAPVAVKPKTTAPKRAKVGKPVTVKIKLTGAAGNVVFRIGKKKQTVALKGGTAKLKFKGVKVGVQKVTWTYAGSSTVKPAKGSFTVTVTR